MGPPGSRVGDQSGREKRCERQAVESASGRALDQLRTGMKEEILYCNVSWLQGYKGTLPDRKCTKEIKYWDFDWKFTN